MKVSFSKLRDIKVGLGFDWKDIHENAGVHNTVIAKINKDQFIKMESLATIVEYLNNTYNKDYDIGDVVSFKKDSTK